MIVIDCDFRRPTLHRAMNKSNTKNLADYLSETASLEDVIMRDDPSGVHVIYGKTVPGQALDFINSKRMRALVESLGKAYDLVILDAPTTLPFADAQVLATLSDMTLYCVAWNKTESQAIAAGLSKFYDMNYDNVGLVFTHVDMKAFRKFNDNAKNYMAEKI